MCIFSIVLISLCFTVAAVCSCFEPSPAFPVPPWTNGVEDLRPGFEEIENKLKDVIKADKYKTSSFSIEVTSSTETLWSYFHTASEQNLTRPGDRDVDENSLYRIASVSKLFTTLALLYQHDAGTLHLDDPILRYIPELEGEIPWKDITLRILASQLSGIPREFAQGDILNELNDPTALGLPPVSKNGLPKCDEYNNYVPPCGRNDLFEQLKKQKPLFAPNQKSTYSNLNFELLGLAIENVTGTNFTNYIQSAIFDPLNMTSSTFSTPPDTHAVLPLGPNYWGIEEGVQNPTGGIYSSSSDMTKFVRYILTHYNALATGVNWIMPSSWAEGLQSFYGMPFEIFRTEDILQHSRRPVTFVTKSGGLPGYYCRVFILPEYGLGITILVGGVSSLLREIQEVVTVALVQAAEEVTWRDVAKTYDGIFVSSDPNLNSSVRLSSSPSTGLIIESFISNGTDAFKNIITPYFGSDGLPWHAQLTPTLLFKVEAAQEGEIWRIRGITERESNRRGVWDEFCATDVDVYLYGGLPIGELVFWSDSNVVELPAWHLTLIRLPGVGDLEGLIRQE